MMGLLDGLLAVCAFSGFTIGSYLMVGGTLQPDAAEGKDSGFLRSARIVTCFAGSRDAGALLCVMAAPFLCSVDLFGGIPEGYGQSHMATDPRWLRNLKNNLWIRKEGII